MRKIVLFFLFISAHAFSQDVKEIIAKETCECTSKLDLDALNSSDLELKFGLCMLESYNKHIGEFPENQRLDFQDNAQMEKFGEEIALKMLEFCTEIISKLGENHDDSDEVEKNDSSVKGIYNGFLIDAFYTIFIKDSNDKTFELVVLDYFKNVNLITNKLIENSQEIEVYYYEADLFYPKSNKFISTKIITDIIKK
ncbi:hypothetical protein SAMN05428642_102349 [Flaviramulus basaltis]|uniref:Uncharacterized protein n=1 Tax=Flaviramulus basaltis TaxID=369401 RepID=A0A1K2IHR2_9FLAO|nr:hypothetical protein [Flaviramulus basaltis]SFZ91810.1 hypothetical protein SAMN05428642_102349 [Flaviramulus basaltis]